MERIPQDEFNAKLNDLVSYIFTPKELERSISKRRKAARDAIEVIEEDKRIDKEYKL